MKKLKNFYYNNRVFSILMIVAFACLLFIIIMMFKYFFFGASNSNYGNRLDGIDKVVITEKKESLLVKKLTESDVVDSASVKDQGKIIYIILNIKQDKELVDAQSVAVKSLEYFSEKELAFYDLQFFLVQEKKSDDDGFVVMGAKNISSSTIVWNNNNQD